MSVARLLPEICAASRYARRWLGGLFLVLLALHGAAARAETAWLHSLAEVVALPDATLVRDRVQVRFEGVVLYVPPGGRRIYVQDGEHGIQANLLLAGEYHPGQRVAVAGVVEAGLPALRLSGGVVTVLGEAPLPAAPTSSAQRFAQNQDLFRWVKARGVVRDMFLEQGVLTLLLTAEGLPFGAAVQTFAGPLPADWLDAEVEITGLCAATYNPAGRVNGFRFHTTMTQFVKILRPGIADLGDRPLLSIAAAASQPRAWQPRHRIAGTVTLHRGIDLYVQDETGVMHANLLTLLDKPPAAEGLPHDATAQFQPGDRVEVIGARENWFFLAPMLLHAECRRVGAGPPVTPIRVSGADLQAGRHAGELVTVQARLLNQRSWGERATRRHLMMLQAGDEVFQATWAGERPESWGFKLDDYHLVTGVNEAQSGQVKDRITFELRLRGPQDVVPTSAPPFWQRPGMRQPLFVGVAVAAVAAAWIAMLRGQMRRLRRLNEAWEERVQHRTAELRVALAAEKELNQLKSSFVSMVSHEFRTPLEVILSSSNILDLYLDRLAPERRTAQLRAIRKSVHRMSDLIEDVLLLGKFDAGRLNCNPVPLDLAAFCARAIAEVETAAGREGAVRCALAALPTGASADESLLHHVLTNLLSNALKFSPADGVVELAVTRQGCDAEFTIRDHGCGIPTADQPRLFTAFYRGSNAGHTPGSGLGLVIARRCVDLHGGTIRCASQEGVGTTFFVTLPLFDGTRHFRRRADAPPTAPPDLPPPPSV